MPDDHTSNQAHFRAQTPSFGKESVSIPACLFESTGGLDETVLACLTHASLDHDRELMKNAANEARRLGISDEALADDYIPHIVRQLGMAWCSDETNFALVTIASARLQALLRDISKSWSSNNTADFDAPNILVLLPKGSDHTLGPIALAGQLRRRGMSVRLLLDASLLDIKTHLRQTRFDAVMISGSQPQMAGSIAKICASIRSYEDKGLPIIVGGAMLGQKDAPSAASLGADFVTNDPDEAIALCVVNQKNRMLLPLQRED